MRNIPAKYLPDHLLGIEFWIVGRQEEKGEPWISLRVFLYRFSMMKSYVIENHDDGAARVAMTDDGKKCLECLHISRSGDVSCQDAVSEIDRSKQGSTLFRPKAHRNDGLYSFLRPHAGSGRN